MRTLTSTLLTEQRQPSRRPAIKLEVQQYGHPLKSDNVHWTTFNWERLYSGSETQNFHGVAIPQDGSLNRIRLDGTNLYHQRVTSPDENSDYSQWGGVFGGTSANSHNAIAAHNAEVMVAAAGAASTWRRQSADNGATWASWVNMNNTNPCERGCAIAYKSNGDCAIVHASDVNDPKSLYIQTRTSGVWSSGLGQRAGDWEIEGLTMYYDGDWNIIALVIEGNYLVAVRMVYGDGYNVPAGTWATDQKIGLGRARLDIPSQMALRKFGSQWYGGGEARHTPTYWEKHQAVLQELAGETLDISGASLYNPSSYSLLLSLSRQGQPWLFRLRQGADFMTDRWTKADIIYTDAAYGLHLAADTTHLWATQADEVWRTTLPSYWEPPDPGPGPGSKVTLPTPQILRIAERIDPEQRSELVVELDNSKGTYDSPGSGDLTVLKRGSRVNLHIGYYTPQGEETEELSRYFVESWQYDRSRKRAAFSLNCIDAWGLLDRFQFNKPVEWNIASNSHTVYALIALVLESIDATLGYKSRSSLITSLYPKMEVHAGETASSIVSRLLSLVPDVIYFYGLQAYIVYPQADDAAAYAYTFPSPA